MIAQAGWSLALMHSYFWLGNAFENSPNFVLFCLDRTFFDFSSSFHRGKFLLTPDKPYDKNA